MKPFLFTFILLFLFVPGAAAQEGDYLGCFGFGCNSFDPDSLANEFGAGSPFNPDSPANPYGRFGSPYSPDGARNPYTTGGAEVYREDGEFRGRLNSNQYDPDFIATSLSLRASSQVLY